MSDSQTSARFISAVPQFAVRDLVQTTRHYRDVLGFEIAGYWDGERVQQEPPESPLFAIARRDQVELFFNRTAHADSAASHAGALSAYFNVRGIDALAQELRARGADILEGPEDRPYGRRELVVRDCNGVVLAFGEVPA